MSVRGAVFYACLTVQSLVSSQNNLQIANFLAHTSSPRPGESITIHMSFFLLENFGAPPLARKIRKSNLGCQIRNQWEEAEETKKEREETNAEEVR